MYEKLTNSYSNSSDEEEDTEAETEEEFTEEDGDSHEEAVEEDGVGASEPEDDAATGQSEDDEEGVKENLIPNLQVVAIEKVSSAANPSHIAANKKKSAVPTKKLVIDAIRNLCDRKGSSVQAIRKYIINNNSEIDESRLRVAIKKYLPKAVADGTLEQTRGIGAVGSFKLSAKSTKEQLLAEKTKAKKEKEKLLQKEKQRKIDEKNKIKLQKEKAKEMAKLQSKSKSTSKEKPKKETTTKTGAMKKMPKSTNNKNDNKTDAEKAADIIVKVDGKPKVTAKKAKTTVESTVKKSKDIAVESTSIKTKSPSKRKKMENENPEVPVKAGAKPKPNKKKPTAKATASKEEKAQKKPASQKLKGDKALEAIQGMK